jgi:hypothetical protein
MAQSKRPPAWRSNSQGLWYLETENGYCLGCVGLGGDGRWFCAARPRESCFRANELAAKNWVEQQVHEMTEARREQKLNRQHDASRA